MGKGECSFHFQQMPFCTEETNALIEHHNSSLSWGRKKLIYLAFCSIALGYFCPLCDDVRCAPHTAKLLLLRFPSFNCILPAIYLAKVDCSIILHLCRECIGISSALCRIAMLLLVLIKNAYNTEFWWHSIVQRNHVDLWWTRMHKSMACTITPPHPSGRPWPTPWWTTSS